MLRYILFLVTWLCSAQLHAACIEPFKPGDPRLYDFLGTRPLIKYEPWSGHIVKSIDVIVLPVFNPSDPKENNRFYQALNGIHIDTRESTVADELVVEEGEPLDVRALLESERLLRDADYLGDAMILPREVCDNEISLLVVVRDVWTLTPKISFSRSGGSNESDYGFEDSNIFGTGRRASITVEETKDRRGVGFAYRDSNIGNGRYALRLAYADNDDGEEGRIQFTRPFFSQDTRWSAGAASSYFRLEESVESGELTLAQFEENQEFNELFVGFSAGRQNGRTQRWFLGAIQTESEFERIVSEEPDELETPTLPVPLPGGLLGEDALPDIPEDRLLKYPYVRYEYVEDKFLTTTNLASFYRIEDLPLGHRLNVQVGYASESLGSTEDSYLFNMGHDFTGHYGERHLVFTALNLSGRYREDENEFEDGLLSAEFKYINFIDIANRWQVDLKADAGKNLGLDLRLPLGGEEGLRGYPDDFQSGDRRVIFSIERRRFFDIHIFNLVRVGAAMFVDTGRAWSDDDDFNGDNDGWLANAGFGLRLNSSKARSDKTLHIDVGFPIEQADNADRVELTLTAKTGF